MSVSLMLALIPVRDGTVPAGTAETIGECGGRVLLAGTGVDRVDAGDLGGTLSDVRTAELGTFAAGAWALRLASVVAAEPTVVLPASADGRDLAPRLAHALGRRLHAGAVEVDGETVVVATGGGSELHTWVLDEPAVVTFEPGVRGADPGPVDSPPRPVPVDLDPAPADVHDAELVALLPPDLATMDLSEAQRIVGGGAGLDGPERFGQLTAIAAAIGGVMGATRVITDRSWVGHERQIGTTGVVVDPALYLAFGISGAVQHTAGLGDPDHIISVNTDAHCPMMQMSDLAIVSDANAVLDELTALLAEPHGTREVDGA